MNCKYTHNLPSYITYSSASCGIKCTSHVSTSGVPKSWELLVLCILTHFSQLLLYLCFTDGNRGLEGLILKCIEKISREIRPHMTWEPAGERSDFQGSYRKLVGGRGNGNILPIFRQCSLRSLWALCCRQGSLAYAPPDFSEAQLTGGSRSAVNFCFFFLSKMTNTKFEIPLGSKM